MVTKRITRKKAVKEETTTIEEKNLRNYELVFVIRPDMTEENLDAAIEKTSKIITNKGGTVTGMDRWGKRKLAYPIKHFMEGYYILGKFKCLPAASREIEANLQITEEIIRFLVIKVD